MKSWAELICVLPSAAGLALHRRTPPSNPLEVTDARVRPADSGKTWGAPTHCAITACSASHGSSGIRKVVETGHSRLDGPTMPQNAAGSDAGDERRPRGTARPPGTDERGATGVHARLGVGQAFVAHQRHGGDAAA